MNCIVLCRQKHLHRQFHARLKQHPVFFRSGDRRPLRNMAFLRLGCALMLLFYIENACAVRQGHVSEVECKEKLVVTAAKQYFIIEAPTIFESPDPAHPPPLTPSRTQTVNSDPLTRKPLKSVPTRPAHATSPKAAAPKTTAYSRDARV